MLAFLGAVLNVAAVIVIAVGICAVLPALPPRSVDDDLG
jgi:hypothetical protein